MIIKRLKVVPKLEPNADGKWIKLVPPVSFDHSLRFTEKWEALESYVPKGMFLVKTSEEDEGD